MKTKTAFVPSCICIMVMMLSFMSTSVQAQTNYEETANHSGDIRLNPSVLRSSAIRFSLQPPQIPFKVLDQPAPFTPVPQGRLPMFCALEKKLNEACKVWIKIRLE